jgi:hypothetical protein
LSRETRWGAFIRFKNRGGNCRVYLDTRFGIVGIECLKVSQVLDGHTLEQNTLQSGIEIGFVGLGQVDRQHIPPIYDHRLSPIACRLLSDVGKGHGILLCLSNRVGIHIRVLGPECHIWLFAGYQDLEISGDSTSDVGTWAVGKNPN